MLAAAAIGAGAVAAQTADDLAKQRITDPAKDQWQIQGKEQKASIVAAEGVPGGAAIRVRVNRAGKNPWDVQAQSSISGPIKKGDVVLFAFWARADGAPAKINARVQQVAAPYTGVAEGSGLTITPEWKMHYVSGKSPLDLSPGAASAAVHLGIAKQTVELGPHMVLDFGPDYDMSRLPKNE
jgi:hypothetical protein